MNNVKESITLAQLSSLTGSKGNVEKWLRIEKYLIECAETKMCNPVDFASYLCNPDAGFVLGCVLNDLEGYGYLASDVSVTTIDTFIENLDKLENPKDEHESSSMEECCETLIDIIEKDDSKVLSAILAAFEIISNLNSYWRCVVTPVITWDCEEIESLSSNIESDFTAAAVDVLFSEGIFKAKGKELDLDDENSSFNLIRKDLVKLRDLFISNGIDLKRDILEFIPSDHSNLSVISEGISFESPSYENKYHPDFIKNKVIKENIRFKATLNLVCSRLGITEDEIKEEFNKIESEIL